MRKPSFQPNQDGSQWKISVSRDGKYYAKVKANGRCTGNASATFLYTAEPEEGGGQGQGARAAQTGTSLSIQAGSGSVSGFVRSSKSSCHNGRKVTVYRKVRGPDKKGGSDTATPNQDGSQYSVRLTRAGKYYAVVKATSKCKGKTSKTVSVTLSEDEE